MSAVKCPEVKVKLVGEDGNAFAILARVMKAMKSSGIPADLITEYHTEATSGDYDHLLRTTMKWVKVK